MYIHMDLLYYILGEGKKSMQQHYSADQERGYGLHEDYQQPTAQKTTQPTVSHQASSEQRLGLGIVSVIALLLACVAVMGFLTNGGKSTLSWPALILACFVIITLSAAITAINYIFNDRH